METSVLLNARHLPRLVAVAEFPIANNSHDNEIPSSHYFL